MRQRLKKKPEKESRFGKRSPEGKRKGVLCNSFVWDEADVKVGSFLFFFAFAPIYNANYDRKNWVLAYNL